MKGEEPPCVTKGECISGRPDLYLCNAFAWEIYQKCSGQVIVAGMGEVLGIKFEAIQFIFDLYSIYDDEERLNLFEKIIAVDGIRMKIRSDDLITRNRNEKQKAKGKTKA